MTKNWQISRSAEFLAENSSFLNYWPKLMESNFDRKSVTFKLNFILSKNGHFWVISVNFRLNLRSNSVNFWLNRFFGQELVIFDCDRILVENGCFQTKSYNLRVWARKWCSSGIITTSIRRICTSGGAISCCWTIGGAPHIGSPCCCACLKNELRIP